MHKTNPKKINFDNIKLAVYDFDGVMTNNKAYIDANGNEFVQVNRADGLAISLIRKIGIDQIIISSEINNVVSKRAEKLNIVCLHGIISKKNALEKYCKQNKIHFKSTIFVGNDINDKDVMEIAGLTFCPSDAHNSIKSMANYNLKSKGGEGVIRELYDLIDQNHLITN